MIKQMLRKWLEVPDEYVAPKVDFKPEIREVVVEVVKEAFTEDYVSTSAFGRSDWGSIRGTIESQTTKVVDHYSREAVVLAIDSIVEPEAFIDAVVQRIQSKQLGGSK